MTTISTLPDAPSRADPSTFSDKSDALLGALATFVSETNTVAGECVTNAATATTKANEASASASAASSSASAASSSASSASGSASTASSQAASVLTMDKRYLGAFAVAPTLDNQGAALAAGAVYYDTALGKVEVWSGSAWVEGIASVAGVTSINGATGAITLAAVPPGASIYTALNFGGF